MTEESKPIEESKPTTGRLEEVSVSPDNTASFSPMENNNV